MRKQKGFSLIELLIVVAIILIIAAIAIPNLLRSRIAANEASAVGSMRTINTSLATYASTYANIGYPTALADIGGTNCATVTATNACLIDAVLAAASTAATPKSGYFFTYVPVTLGGLNTSFTINATPATAGKTGVRTFYTDDSGVIRFRTDGAAATATDTPLQ